MRIAICTPSRDEVKTSFAYALIALVQHSHEHDLMLLNERLPDVAKARNRLVIAALHLKCDKILWLDSDMNFPPHLLEKMLARERPVVGCTYAIKNELSVQAEYALTAHDSRDTSRLPGGCMLVDALVYRKLSPPWYVNSDDVPEDWYFCDRVREQNIPVWLDRLLSVQLAHLGEFSYRLT